MSHFTRLGRAAAALALAALAAFLPAGLTDASSIRLPLTELSARSPVVVRGHIERIDSAWTADRRIESTVYVRLSDVPRGHLSKGALIPVRVLGGRVDGITMFASEEPTFAAGEDVYLFLSGLSGNAYRVSEGRQGKFDIAGDTAVNRAWHAEFRLGELEAGVRGGRWPADPSYRGAGDGLLLTPDAGASPLSALDGVAGAAATVPESYTLSGQKWPGSNPSATYLININTADAGGANGSAAAFRNAIVAAANTWNNVGTAFTFRDGGASGVTSTALDGQNVIHWEDMGQSSILAQAMWWFNGANIVEADLRFNDYWTWDATGSRSADRPDLQSIATHELGHWLSLGHDTDSGCPNSTPIMCPSYVLGTVKRGLGANDIAGIRALYGNGNPPTSTPTYTPTGTSTPTRTPTPTLTPTPWPTLAPWQVAGRVHLPMIMRR